MPPQGVGEGDGQRTGGIAAGHAAADPEESHEGDLYGHHLQGDGQPAQRFVQDIFHFSFTGKSTKIF
jgi:hypothetical protein